MMRWLKVAGLAVLALVVLAVGGSYGASYYYTTQLGQGCSNCHEMAEIAGAVHGSAHRTVGCLECHEASMATKLRHIRVHLFGSMPEAIRLRDVDAVEMVPQCKRCHQEQYAGWHAGPHSATYAEIFTNPVQNTKQHLMNDCLRCHGAHFGGSIRDLVAPLDTKGPWHLLRPELAAQPAIPCLQCHWIHSEGTPQTRPEKRRSVAAEPEANWLGFYDRRERVHFAAYRMAIPAVYDGPRPVTMSQDPRQAVCYQCHAPRNPEPGTEAAAKMWGRQVGSGDDRTPMGVHEGISCEACHLGHSKNTRASCKTCHPKMSNCGLDVETMDTTYARAGSPHNIHWVKCADCHTHGVPKPKAVAAEKAPSPAIPGKNG